MDAKGVAPKEVTPASRKLGRDDAVELIESAEKVIVAKGKKVQVFPGGKATDDVVQALLGPTGNLRAPTARVGKTLLVGFNEDTYADVLD